MDITAPRFTNEDKAREHLEAIRWPEGPFCPHCGSFSAKRLPAQRGKPSKRNPEGKLRVGVIQCNDCRQQYSVTVGTLFEDSKVPLNKWLLANHLLCSSKKGMSAHQIGRMLGVTYKTAWFMCHRIREAMKQDTGPMGGPGKIVEADETFVGGKAKNRAWGKIPTKQAVYSLVERNGNVVSYHVANITVHTLKPLLLSKVHRASTLMTDEAPFYKGMGKQFAAHERVHHGQVEYARGQWHTNTIENFFSIMKRGIVGVYHHVSEAHLNRYCAEFDFRYNTREDTDAERAMQALRGIYGKRLTYRRADAIAA
ncbi:MAG: IS1595 family transposase [Allosphingosinicella sp.]|uniref:IS1595 family transposase n=1 Tax=Allosphingosinicella sp. TaxID=2823234 RepID=UPI00393BF51A